LILLLFDKFKASITGSRIQLGFAEVLSIKIKVFQKKCFFVPALWLNLD